MDGPPLDAKDPIEAAFARYLADIDELYALVDLESWLLENDAVAEEGLTTWVHRLEAMDGERYHQIAEIEFHVKVECAKGCPHTKRLKR